VLPVYEVIIVFKSPQKDVVRCEAVTFFHICIEIFVTYLYNNP